MRTGEGVGACTSRGPSGHVEAGNQPQHAVKLYSNGTVLEWGPRTSSGRVFFQRKSLRLCVVHHSGSGRVSVISRG